MIKSFLLKCYQRRDLRNLFVLAIILRLLFCYESLHQVGVASAALSSPDAVEYVGMARSVIDGTDVAERWFFTFGPGYAYFLCFWMFLLGERLFLLILLNILLSSISCLLVYRLGKMITGSYAVGMVAGVLAAMSYTSITLSSTLLSDSLYFFLFTASLVLLLQALENDRWRTYLLVGALVGAAALTRGIGQFWPIMMILVMISVRVSKYGLTSVSGFFSRRKSFLKPAVCVLVSVLFIGAWVLRNNSVHGVPVLTMSGTVGLAKVAGLTLERIEGTPFKEIQIRRVAEFKARTGIEKLTPSDYNRALLESTKQVFSEHTGEMLETYRYWTWRNMNEISYFHRTLLPEFNPTLIPLEETIKKYYLNYVCFALSVLGLLLLLFKRKFLAATILGLIYIYYVPLVGLTAHQGSRIFFPAQASWAILVAVVLVSAVEPIGRWFGLDRHLIDQS